MNHNVEFKDFDALEEKKLRKLIDDLIARLDKKARGLSPDPVFLRLMVEENSAHKVYTVSVALQAPGKTLAAKGQTHEPEAAIRAAFDEIERQLLDYKSSMRGEYLWKRLARRGQIRQKKGGPLEAEQQARETFFVLVNPHLDAIEDFARHEIAYAEATGDLIRGEVTAEDITDAALLRAYQEFIKDPARGDVRSWLLKLAIDQLETEIKHSRFERARTVRIEDIPETPPTEAVSTLGDEILDFHQPDEDLKLEDVIPDIQVPTPEQEVETKELRQCVRAALGAMPREWRRLLILRYVQGLQFAELARATGKPETEIDRELEHARATLRQKLIESGCSFKPSSAQKTGREESIQAAR